MSTTETNKHNFWRRFIVALPAAVANLHGRIILATTVRLLGEVIYLHVKLHPTALLNAGKMYSLKSNKLVQLFLLSEAKTLQF